MASIPSAPDGALGFKIAVILGGLLSLLLIRWLDRTNDWPDRLRARLLLGVPWGTLLSVGFVLAVYLFVQDGAANWRNPVTIPYRSWSYFYPLGMLFAGFAHQGPGHLIGNLIGTVVLAPLAEYAWGHYPRARGASSFSSPMRNPYVRAFVAFPAGVAIVGLLTSVFSWGPLIGFSGVVFAFAGFALVRYPLGVVVALAARSVVRIVYRALQDPIVTAEARPRFIRPWWAGISVQGHLLGLFLGIVAAAIVLRRRDLPSPSRLWAGSLLVATSFSLWAVWWFRGGSRYVLYRAPGTLFVFTLALLITLGMYLRRSDRRIGGVPSRQIAVMSLLLPILVVGFAAVPLNLNTVSGADAPAADSAIEIRDYTVAYAENVTNGMTSVVNLSLFGETTRVRTSGVIVVSERRNIWTTAISKSRLAFLGRTNLHVGGLGWRQTVAVQRRGWSAVGNSTAYIVWLRPPDGEWRVAYRSDPVTAEPTIAGRNVTVRSVDDRFELAVRRNGTPIDAARIPEQNVTAGGLRFVRDGDAIYAARNGTRVRIANRETYRDE